MGGEKTRSGARGPRPPAAANAWREARRGRSILIACLFVAVLPRVAEAAPWERINCLQPTRIDVYAGDLVYGMTTYCADGQTYNHGAQGGTRYVLQLQPDEYIRRLTFSMNKGAEAGDYRIVMLQIQTTHQSSPVYGGQGGMQGEMHDSTVPQGHRFAGFNIRAGNYVEDISVITERRPDDSPLPGRLLAFYVFGAGYLASHPNDASTIVQVLEPFTSDGSVSRLASWTVERSPSFPDYFLLRNAASGLLLYKDLQTGLVRAGNIPPDSRNAAWFFQLNDKRRQGVGGNEYRIVNLWDNSFIGRPCGSLPPNADPLALLTDTNECWNWHAWSVTYMHKYTQREAVIEWFDAAQYALPPPPVSPPGRPVAPPAPIAATPAPTPQSAPPPAANAAFANTCWLAIAQSHRYDTIDDERWFATKTNMLGGVILFELAPPSAAGDVLMGWGAAPRPPFGLIPDGTGGFSDEATALWFQPDGIASLQIEDPRDPGRSILYRLYRVPLADDSMRVQYTTWYTDDISGTAMRHSGYGPNMDLESCNRLQEGL